MTDRDAGPDSFACAAALHAEIGAALAQPAGRIDAEQFEQFLALQRRLGLVQGERPLCRHLAPVIIGGERWRRVAEAAELVVSALGKVAARALADRELAIELGLSPEEEQLAAIDPGYPQSLAVGRLDMLIDQDDADSFRFIELNADSPAGITDQWLVRQTLMGLPHLAPFLARPGIRVPSPHLALVQALQTIAASWCERAGRPASGGLTLAIVDWADVDTAAEIALLVGVFGAAGHRAVFVDPSELRYDGSRLSARGLDLDLVYRRVITQELLDRGGFDHPLIRAYRDGAVCVANSFRAKLSNKKAAFAVLSDPAFRAMFSRAERRAIDAHVPWTRRVKPGRTTWRGRAVDLHQLLIAERERMVLKPNDDYGGKGVLLGWLTPPDRWRAALDSAKHQSLVAQERQMTHPASMPTYRGGVIDEEVYTDLCPFLFAGKVEGAIVRVSSSPMTNVSAGGGITGLLIVDAEAELEAGASHASEIAAHV